MTRALGICDICRQILTFTSVEARDAWEANHPHEEDE